MKNKFPYRLYLVLSEESCPDRDFIDVARQAIEGGVGIIQLREKEINTNHFIEKASRLQEILSERNIPLIINDNLEVAQRVNAYGIHVGNTDVPPSHIRSAWNNCQSLGYSIEYLHQLNNTEILHADYLGISPVFKTNTKTDTITEWGLQGIRQIRAMSDKPLVAIGNMNAENVYEVIKAGADCIAVVSAICNAKDPAQAAFEIRNNIEKAL